MSLRIERTRALALLQDGGRFGVRHLGVTQGGALDWVSMRWANWLLGNALAAPVLEITLGGLALSVEADGVLGLAGADLGATLDGAPLPPWRAVAVRRGQRLVFDGPKLGVRAYLAAPGGFEAPALLGSCATVVREGLGGLEGDGKPVAEGDVLRWRGPLPEHRRMPATAIPDWSRSATLDVVVGAQIGDFDGQSLFDAFNTPWQIDTRSDRMGMRLLGPALRSKTRTMISEGVPLGAVQVPPDGQPIVLLNDRQTIGGYPRIGALTPLAIARLAQCLPGSAVRLRPVVAAQAQQAHRRALASWP
ncbi:biotin-dependent carboxyltransferase [Stutzerimonas urumqiensis]|uniref:5-oxoprolinase subunit C family protein n=1 Tax=Stutzerimonas urumqiensis TaxID=638269 RepID=UPI003BAD7F94